MFELSGKSIPRSFYIRPTVDVARELLGQILIHTSPQGKIAARIVETEAYIGENDPACHAARGKTKRNEVMFGSGGFSYVYFIYGMYNCFNIVTEKEGFASAVLIRAAEPLMGEKMIAANSPANQTQHRLLAGPGKLCRGMSITREQNGLDLTKRSTYLVYGEPPEKVCVSSRIGISRGKELPYRFYDAASPSVSKR